MTVEVTFQLSADPPKRLDKALARDVPQEASLSRSRLAKLLEAGAVTVNGVVVTELRVRPSEADQIGVTIEVAEESHMLGEDIAVSYTHLTLPTKA